jgi:hypothetical protein
MQIWMTEQMPQCMVEIADVVTDMKAARAQFCFRGKRPTLN